MEEQNITAKKMKHLKFSQIEKNLFKSTWIEVVSISLPITIVPKIITKQLKSIRKQFVSIKQDSTHLMLSR